jgi:hypothetical protein
MFLNCLCIPSPSISPDSRRYTVLGNTAYIFGETELCMICVCVCVKNKGMKTKYIHNLFPNVSTCAYILVDTIMIHSKLKIFGLKQTALCIEK